MPQRNLENLYKEISNLTGNEKKIILYKLIAEMSLPSSEKGVKSIHSIKGIGKEIWCGIDAQEYVKNERSSFD